MTEKRQKNLKRNFGLMFWIQGLLCVKVMNLVSTLFYINRGLTLSEIFYTAIVFAVVNLFFEIPSSYLADKWGRKKTIMLAAIFAALGWTVQIFAFDFASFLIAFAFMALSYACMSGTDDALIYDTNRELGSDSRSLQELGRYYSAQRFLKIITPLIGAIIAKDLVEWQFILLLFIDIAVALGALFLATRLTEPHHYMDLEKVETGTFIDAYNLIRYNPDLIRSILGKTLLFIASFIIWRVHQKFFIDLGISVLALGIGWTFINTATFIFNHYIYKFLHSKPLNFRINILNIYAGIAMLLLVLSASFFSNRYIVFVFFACFLILENIRWPLYSEYFNNFSLSHNRATTLSLANLLKSILDIPIIFIASVIVNLNIIYVFVLAFILCLISLAFFQTPKMSLGTVARRKDRYLAAF